jgi:homopolymeric O-antigen transport system ATP-binding protein
MSETIIVVENLSKRYLVGHQSQQRGNYATLRDVIGREARNFGRNAVSFVRGRPIVQGDEVEEFWALQDVTFEVKRGEVLGIIGRNGAGKSTLLKILSRITDPDQGRAILRGRVASLLEVGTGFHPELTGRQNIYLNGAILGMRKAEIKSKFDEIVAFSDVERFLDTPVKYFSSGMYVRLAFAVAAHLEPEILIVDEVLAVGDIEFQKKCLGKMHDVAAKHGRTVLFVSHNLGAIKTLCARGLLLEGGQTRGVASVNSAIEAYLLSNSRFSRLCQQRRLSATLTLDFLRVEPDAIISGASLTYVLQLSSTVPVELAEISILLSSSVGTRIAVLDLRMTEIYRFGPGRPLKLSGRINSLPLVEGNYSLGLYVKSAEICEDVYDLANISIKPLSGGKGLIPYLPQDRGFFELAHEFELEKGGCSSRTPHLQNASTWQADPAAGMHRRS